MKYNEMLLTPWQVNDSAAAKMVQIGGSALTNSKLISVAVGITPDQAKQLLNLAGNDLHALAKMTLTELSSGILLSHNHPSGDLSPSDSDLKITKKIKDAAQLLDITVLDHLIVSGQTYLSMADDNLMP
jgi:DNA repair protein RadC